MHVCLASPVAGQERQGFFNNISYEKNNLAANTHGSHLIHAGAKEIATLPTKVLIDPAGKIIGRFGGGGDNDEAMDIQLANIFK